MNDSSKATAASEFVSRLDDRSARLFLVAGVVAIAYYSGANVGFALTFAPHPTSVVWPPNALLLAAILLLPPRFWWLPIVAALPAHLLVELRSGVPLTMVLGWFVSNCTEALIGATCIRQVLREEPLRFDSFRHVCIFLVCAVLVAPLLSTFLDSLLVTAIGWGHAGFWDLVRTRFLSSALASLIIVPLVVSWTQGGIQGNWQSLRTAATRRQVEVSAIFLGLIVTCLVIFEQSPDSAAMPALLYAPLPFLLWSAVRLGPQGISASLLAVASLAIWGALHELGPFIAGSPAQDTRSVQLFLIAVAVPMLLFVAVMTERKETRRALQLSEERSLKVFRSSPDPIVIARKSDLVIADVNDKWEAMFGYRRAEAIGRTTVELGIYANPGDRKTYVDLCERGLVRDFATDMRDRHGQIHHMIMSGDSVEIGGVECLITIARDVTRQRLMEREAQEQRVELMHLSRVAMLGELSGALAHQLNQPLTAILSNAQAAQRLLARDRIEAQDLREILQDIVSEDKRAGDVIRRLRALFKKGETQLQKLDANELVREVLSLVHGSLTSRYIRVAIDLSTLPVFVRGDRVQLQQVLLNLVSNAGEAMEAPGSVRLLTVKTAPNTDERVQIIVTDGGPGVPDSIMARLFDPFFTTKPQGLGLGLSISRSIIAAHGGELLVRNNPGGGATFRIMLPIQQ